MTCTVEVRARADDIAGQLEAQPFVLSADVLEPAEGPRDEWTMTPGKVSQLMSAPETITKLLTNYIVLCFWQADLQIQFYVSG